MASPNPEGNESRVKTNGINQARQTQHAQTARNTQPLRSPISNNNSDQPDCNCCQPPERFAVGKLFLSCVLTAATIGAFVAASIYAAYARQQVQATKDTVAKMGEAERAELRAYVSLGDKQGKWIAISKSGATLFVYNAGRTPARHFILDFDLSPTGTSVQLRHIERIAIVKGFGKGAMPQRMLKFE